MLRKCSRQRRRAALVLRERAYAGDRKLVEKCDDILKGGEDPCLRAKQVWSALRARSQSLALSKLHPLDDKQAETIDACEDGFLEAAAATGELMVERLDGGANSAAYEAWIEAFGMHFETIKGIATVATGR